MSVQALSSLLAAIICAALAVALLIRDPKNRLHTSFSALNGVLCVFYLSSFIFGISDERFWFRLSVLSSLGVPAAAIRFFTIFLGQSEGIGHKATQVSVTVSLLLAPFVFSELINRGFVKLIVLTFVFVSLLLCMLMIFDRLRQTTSRVEAARLKYLLAGGLAAIVFSLTDYLPRIDVPWVPAIGNSVTVLYMYFLSQIIIQFRLLDLNELVGKMLVLAILMTLLATVYGLTGFFVSDIPGLIFFNTFVSGFVILILFEPITRVVEDRVNRLLFRERYEFGRQLALLRRELANVVDVDQMAHLVLTRLENSRRVTGTSVYILDEGGATLQCAGYLGAPPVDVLDAVAERPFLDRIQMAKALVNTTVSAERRELLALAGPERLSGEGALEDVARLQRTLAALEADVSIAMVSEDLVVGLLNVRDDRMREAYSPEELAHLVAIANQGTICIENSRIVDRLRDRDRLAAVGEMAAGLAHEVRNPLGAIKGAAQMLHDDPELPDEGESVEFVEIIIEEVNRLNKVVSDFLDYAKPYGGADKPCPVNKVIERVVTLIRTERNAEIDLSLYEELPPGRVDPEILRQVLWNLCLNATQAMESPERPSDADDARLTIHTRLGGRGLALSGTYSGRDTIEIAVSDNGPGIAAADLERIFIPFWTTKQKGTGLGLALCQRLIRAAGGDLVVASKLGDGATFTIRLAPWTDDAASASGERVRRQITAETRAVPDRRGGQ